MRNPALEASTCHYELRCSSFCNLSRSPVVNSQRSQKHRRVSARTPIRALRGPDARFEPLNVKNKRDPVSEPIEVPMERSFFRYRTLFVRTETKGIDNLFEYLRILCLRDSCTAKLSVYEYFNVYDCLRNTAAAKTHPSNV